jgi:beta-glucosidase
VRVSRPPRSIGAALVCASLALACGKSPPPEADSPQNAPPPPNVVARVSALLSRMTLDEKIGQMTAVTWRLLASDADIAKYGLGSVISGGGDTPDPNTPASWADMVDRFQRAALSSRLAIPILYGIDAVHGHGNCRGATIFPHNIGLGAARDPALVQAVAGATAEELAGTGIRWNFAPSVSVVQDERWGRTFESFGEVPSIATSYATYVTGLQGAALGPASTSVLATAKHWIGDGATSDGVETQCVPADPPRWCGGDAPVTEAELRRTHLPPFVAAINAGAGAVMVSHSSVGGVPMHANQHLITDVLKGELGFDGIVVSDWGGTGNVSNDYAYAVRTAVNAGVDMVMVPYDYRTFTSTLRAEVEAGRVPVSRIDDAVTRILTKKVEMGVFEHPFVDRTLTPGVGSAAHRELARRAVRESLVLLKNTGVLPLAKGIRKIFVAGKSGDDIGNQAGGWTIQWQGQSGAITPGTSIVQAIRARAGPSVDVVFGRDASGIDSSFDVAVVAIGETPYAEWVGDRDADGILLDAEDQATLDTVKASGVPTVVIVVSGRPLIVTDRLANWQALVAAWLPGTEAAGIADVLFGDYAPTGKLPITWPRTASQLPMPFGAPGYDPLFAFGFGLGYNAPPVAMR